MSELKAAFPLTNPWFRATKHNGVVATHKSSTYNVPLTSLRYDSHAHITNSIAISIHRCIFFC
jgi:hypothetical protein